MMRPTAWRGFSTRIRTMLYRLARRLTDSADDARDLVQDTFLRAAKAPRRVPCGQANEQAWLVRVLVNIRRDQWRKQEVRKRSKAVIDVTPVATNATQESDLVTRAEIWSALDQRHPRRRTVIVLTNWTA